MSARALGDVHRVLQSMSIAAVPISVVRVRALIAASEGNGDPAGARVMDSVSGHVQKLVDERDRDRSLAHRRCDALDVPGPNVAHREHAGTTRFEKIRRPRERPASVRQFILRDIRARLDKPFVVERNAPIQPIRIRYRTGRDENVLSDAWTTFGSERSIAWPRPSL
jgi:hypothetical protein